jgi:hypothetical protein
MIEALVQRSGTEDALTGAPRNNGSCTRFCSSSYWRRRRIHDGSSPRCKKAASVRTQITGGRPPDDSTMKATSEQLAGWRMVNDEALSTCFKIPSRTVLGRDFGRRSNSSWSWCPHERQPDRRFLLHPRAATKDDTTTDLLTDCAPLRLFTTPNGAAALSHPGTPSRRNRRQP